MKQNPICVWFTGLSGAGKSVIAEALKEILQEAGKFSIIVDGDVLRSGVSWDLKFNISDRTENVYRAAQIAKLLTDNNVIALVTLISPLHVMRKMARDIIGSDMFFEVHVNTPLGVCEKRDCKGLYSQARAGKIKDLTGIDSPYEDPLIPQVLVSTADKLPKECAEIIYNRIKNQL